MSEKRARAEWLPGVRRVGETTPYRGEPSNDQQLSVVTWSNVRGAGRAPIVYSL